jgi:hypothetical protein
VLSGPVVGGDVASGGSGGNAGGGHAASSHRAARHKEFPVESIPVVAAPVETIVAAPVIKEPTVDQVAGIKVGTTSSELRATLGAPESKVSIPGDDGHLLEICQYWAKGEAIGTIRLDNGRVISVQASN